MDMKYLVRSWASLCAVVLCLTACGSSDDDGAPVADVETVQLIISVPATSTGTRMGDPGTAVNEGADWDQLAVILAYTDDSQVTLPGGSRVLVKTLSKSEFDNLLFYNNSTTFKLLTIDAQPGTVYIYGVTYSSDAANNPEGAIKACKSNDQVKVLSISNDYASSGVTIDYAKFVSVATGYYQDATGDLSPFEIKEGGTGQIGEIPTMTLTRLAAKIDIQWDAADAYEAGYTDVKVTDFKYDSGNASVVDVGFGRLFPDLVSASATAIGGSKEFYNTLEISQRNGRVYHYVFPDGVSKPSVTFNISAKQTGGTERKSYTMNFPSALQKATWYKVNATIKGITGDGTITLSMDNNTGVQTGG